MSVHGLLRSSSPCQVLVLLVVLMAGCEQPAHHGHSGPGPAEPVVEAPEPAMALPRDAQEQSPEPMQVEQPAVPADPSSESEPIYQVGGEVVKPERISGDDQDLAALGRAHRIRGVMIFQVVITKEGQVRDLRFLKLGDPELAEPIREAVKSWRFKPATLHGEPVAVYYNVTLHIRLQ